VSKIIERIQKLLKLAANAGSEAEAALAAERAAELMTLHEIHEAQLTLDGPNVPRKPEPIDTCYQATDTSKKVAWHMRVLAAVARSYGAHAYWLGGKVILFGRLPAVQAATYTGQYLMREIERVTDAEAPSSAWSRSYRNAFRLGCASRIGARLDQKTRPSTLTKMPDGSVQLVPDDQASRVPDAEPAASAGVIAVIKRDREEVQRAYQAFSKKWKKGGSVGSYSSGGGYAAGQEAGARVSLGGGRAGLPRGQGSLK
jgi:hypothetical protein